MKNTKKRIVLGVLILGILFALIPVSSVADTDESIQLDYRNGVALVGHQEKKNADGTYDYRFVAALKDDPSMTGVGFTVEIQYGDNPVRVEKKDISTVYTSMLGGDQAYEASTYGADYLFGVVLRSVPTAYYIGLKVTPYAITTEQLDGFTTACFLNESAKIAPGTMALYYDFSTYNASSNTVDIMNMLGWKILTKTEAASGLEGVTETKTCYSTGNTAAMELKDGKLYVSNTADVSTPNNTGTNSDIYVLMADSDYMALAASQDYVIQYTITIENGTRYFGVAYNYLYSASGKLTPANTGINITKTFLRADSRGMNSINKKSSTTTHFDTAFSTDKTLVKEVFGDSVGSFKGREITVTLVNIRKDSTQTVKVGDTVLGPGLSVLVNGVVASTMVENTDSWDYYGSSTVGDGTDAYGIALLISLCASFSELGVWTLNPDAENPLQMPAVTDTALYEKASADLMETIPNP